MQWSLDTLCSFAAGGSALKPEGRMTAVRPSGRPQLGAFVVNSVDFSEGYPVARRVRMDFEPFLMGNER